MAARHTQQRILDAAERLFARRGFAATSLRNVTSEAGVNLAAVHYHFGSKQALIVAVFARRLGPLNEERLELLEQAEAQAGSGGPSVERILEALVVPTAKLAAREAGELSLLAGLLGRVHDETCAELVGSVHAQFEAVARRFIEALGRVLPHLDSSELRVRFQFVVGAVASSLGDPRRLEFLSGSATSRRGLDGLALSLVTFLAAGLRAPADEPCTTRPPAPPDTDRSEHTA